MPTLFFSDTMPIDMSDPISWDDFFLAYASPTHSSTQWSAASGGAVWEFTGFGFGAYQGNVPFEGTIRSITYTLDGVTLFSVSGAKVDLYNFLMEGYRHYYGPSLMGLYSGADTVNGTIYNDHLEGFAGDDTLSGADGDDIINGGYGIDTLSGGSGADRIGGGDDNDVIHGGDGNDEIDGGAGADQMFGDDGNDRITGGAGDLIDGGAGGDMLYFTASPGVVMRPDVWASAAGQTLSDGTVISNIEQFQLRGSDAMTLAPIFLSAPGYSPLNTLDFYTVLTLDFSGSAYAVGLIANGSTQKTLRVGGEFGDLWLQIHALGYASTPRAAYHITGSDHNDALSGGTGQDIIDFGAGDDTYLSDPWGNDVLDGGAGVDALNFWANGSVPTSGVTIDLAITTQQNSGGAGLLTIVNFESIYGSLYGDILSGNSAGNLLRGDDGDDILHGRDGADVLEGGAGADTLDGGAGVDIMVGGAGDDQYIVDDIADVAIEYSGGGRDTIYTGLVFYQMGDEIEEVSITSATGSYVVGNGLANLMVGNAGADALDGGLGADFMVGGAGDDSYFVDNISDVVVELVNEGRDTIYTSLALYTMGDNVEEVAVTGTTGSYIIGNSLDNLMVGNAGADALDGGAGADFMVGGAGDDSYFVDHISDVVVELANEGEDVIYTSLAYYQMGENVEQIAITGGAGSTIIGNSIANQMYGGSAADSINGGGGADRLTGNDGDDVFVFVAGQADGDMVTDFTGNDAAAGDTMVFSGYGTAAAGATFVQLDATHWQINSADGLVHEIITLANGASVHASDYMFVD